MDEGNANPWTSRLLGAAAASLCVSIIAAVLASAFIIRESYRMHCIGPAQEEQSSEQSRNSSRREEHNMREHSSEIPPHDAAARKARCNSQRWLTQAEEDVFKRCPSLLLEDVDDIFKRCPSAEVICAYKDADPAILSLEAGERCQILSEEDNGWTKVQTAKGIRGYFPSGYLNICDGPSGLPEPLEDSPMNSPSRTRNKGHG